jgi:hypothetical protein
VAFTVSAILMAASAVVVFLFIRTKRSDITNPPTGAPVKDEALVSAG